MNLFISWVNFKMYQRFLKQGDGESLARCLTIAIVPVLLLFNIVLIYDVAKTILDKLISPKCVLNNNTFKLENMLYVCSSIFILNYLLVFFKHKHIKKFQELSRDNFLSSQSDIYFFLYSGFSWFSNLLWLMLKGYLQPDLVRF